DPTIETCNDRPQPARPPLAGDSESPGFVQQHRGRGRLARNGSWRQNTNPPAEDKMITVNPRGAGPALSALVSGRVSVLECGSPLPLSHPGSQRKRQRTGALQNLAARRPVPASGLRSKIDMHLSHLTD